MVKVENIKVAVRLRPFNSREIAKTCKATVTMIDRTTMLFNPGNETAPSRNFKFDYSYWSHDGYKENEDGYFEADGRKYADQKRLFNDLGAGLLENAWAGYNCTLFAYGQTGSGKTYTVMGKEPNKGLIPSLGERLFEEIALKGKHDGLIYQVSISMMEIYNEKVRDLLNKSRQPKHGLSVRQSPYIGFYVEGLKSSPVADYRDIAYQIEEGNKNRTLAATKMNKSSSRAHTIVIINFVQNFVRENKTKLSNIYMVDLAGSERASQTGATGVRFEESKNINKSLMTLGTVIKNLCAQATGRTDQGPSPYRDSKLTMLLKDSIGGNSKTIMVATISPSDEDYEQTLSTLRYADRVKSIKNTAKMNVAATDKLIKDLLSEKEALLNKLKDKPDSRMGYTEDEIRRLRQEQIKEIEQIKSEMQNVEAAWKQRLHDTKIQMEKRVEEERKEKKERQEIPHLYNLNEETTLTGKLYHLIPQGMQVTVGNPRAKVSPVIKLHGPSIAKEHAFLQNRKSIITIHPLQGHVRINGIEITKETNLQHQDRVFFGANNLFVFHHPEEEQRLIEAGKHTKLVTYDTAQSELGQHSNTASLQDQDWLRQEVAETLVRTQDANAMALALKKAVTFEPVVIASLVLGQDMNRSQVYARVQTGNGGEFIWGKNHFLDRYDLMIDMFQKYETGDQEWEPKSITQDPFWEPLETPTLVGVAYLPLESIAYMLDIDDQKIGIYDYQAKHVGYLTVALVPCYEQDDEFAEERMIEEPIDMLGWNISFRVKIRGATGIPKRFKSSWCHYMFYTEPTRLYTNEVMGCVPKYHYERTHSMANLDHKMIKYLEEKSIMIEIYGRQKSNQDVRRGSTHNAYTIADQRRHSDVSFLSTENETRLAGSCIAADTLPEEEDGEDNGRQSEMETNNKDRETHTSETIEMCPTPSGSDHRIYDGINNGIEGHDRTRQVMEDMRKGISSVLEEVLARDNIITDEQHMTEPVMSEVAANTSYNFMKDAMHSNANELKESQQRLQAVNRKMSQIQRLVENKNDKMSKEIKKIIEEV